MSETQVLMTVSNFFVFFLGIISGRGLYLSMEGGRGGASFLSGGEALSKFGRT